MRGVGVWMVTLALGAALAAPAAATPVCLDANGDRTEPGGDDGVLVCFEETPLDGGLSQYDIAIDPNSDTTGTLAILIDFEGLLNQIRGFGEIVDEDGDADLADRFDDDYDADFDSFFRTEEVWTVQNPFPDRLPPNGIRGGQEGSTSYQFSAGTLDDFGDGKVAPLTQLVARGAVEYTGVVSFQGEDFPVIGVVPEPSTAGLLLLGLAGLSLRARSRR